MFSTNSDHTIPTRRRHARSVVIRLTVVLGVMLSLIGWPSAPVLDAALGAGNTYELQVAGRSGVPSNAEAAALNVTAVDPRGPGFLTVYPCGGSLPLASNVNYGPGDTIANFAISEIGSGGRVCIYTSTTTDIVVDVAGWFPAGSDYTSRRPERLVDTRQDRSLATGNTYELQVAGRSGVPSNAEAAALNVTAVDPRGPGFLTVYPCGGSLPLASNVNYGPGDTIANFAISEIGSGGRVCIYTSTTTDIVVDVAGWFPAGSDYTSRRPERLVDTRQDRSLATGNTYELQVAGRSGVPSNAEAAALNVTAVGPRGPGFLTVYPCGGSLPLASNVNYGPGDTIANFAISEIGSGGRVCIYTSTTTDIVVDVAGWFPAGSDYTSRRPERLVDTRPVRPSTAGAAFAGTFDDNSGLDQMTRGIYHRGMGEQVYGQAPVRRGGNHTLWGDGSGAWTGDHDRACGSPDTQRSLTSTPADFNVDEMVYVCRNHMMTSLGEVDGYSILWFSPDANGDDVPDGFTNATTVSWDVNVTDLGGRQWWEVMVIPVGGPTLTCIEWLPCDLPTEGYPNDAIVVSNRASGSPEFTARGVSVNLTGPGQDMCVIDPEGCLSKPIRRTWTMTDNGNGTITVTFDRGTDVLRWVQPGSFASGAVKVVFKSHAYTPSKDPGPVAGNTWHWDNIIVR